MKLEKFNKNSKQRKIVVGAIIGLIVLVGGITLYRTFALYEEKKEFNVLKGRVPDFVSGDVTIAAIIDGEASSTIPRKDDGYVFESVTCTNGAEAEWDSSEWSIKIKNLIKSKTTCTLKFKSNGISDGNVAVDYITSLAESSGELVYDATVDNNLRYIGANPNNYVSFNNELWRIIGVMNNITDSEGNTGSHIKLIRNESIGTYSWSGDVKTNDWSRSKLNSETLNGTYYDELTNFAQNMIANVVWNLGGVSTWTSLSALNYYGAERGSNVYSSNSTTWTGKIALMYPSDYGYSSNGIWSLNPSSNKTHTWCAKSSDLYSWDSHCQYGSWLRQNSDEWLLTQTKYSYDTILYMSKSGDVVNGSSRNSYVIRPVLYLSSNTAITAGDGSQESPYQLKLGS